MIVVEYKINIVVCIDGKDDDENVSTD